MEKDAKLKSEGSKWIPRLRNGSEVCKGVTIKLLAGACITYIVGLGFSIIADVVKNRNNSKMKIEKGGNNGK